MAAAITLLGQSWNSTTGTHSATQTPAVGDLIVIVCGNTGITGNPTISDDNPDGLGTYTQVVGALKNSSADKFFIYVRDALIGSASSTIFSVTGPSSTGGGLSVYKVTGMTRVGVDAARSTGKEENAAAGTPAPVLSATPLSTSGILTAIADQHSGAPGLTGPSGYTQRSDIGYSSPSTGQQAFSLNSGETSATITWGSANGQTFLSMAVELDSTPPPVVVSPSPDTAAVASVAPSTILGSLALGPSARVAGASRINPSIQLSSLVIVPAAAVASVASAPPEVPTIITPAELSAAVSAAAPTVILGSIQRTPEFSIALAAAVPPAIVLGSLAVTPAPASAAGAVIPPDVPTILVPAFASAACGAVAPTAIQASLVITPAPAQSGAAVGEPGVLSTVAAHILAKLTAMWEQEAGGIGTDSHNGLHLTNDEGVTNAEGLVGQAGHYSAAGAQRLRRADEPALSPGQDSFAFCGWFWLDSTPSESGNDLLGKWSAPGDTANAEYAIELYTAGGQQHFRFFVSSDGSAVTGDLDQVETIGNGEWHFFAAWYDHVGGSLNYSLNDGPVRTVAYSAGIFDGGMEFTLGVAVRSAGRFFDGRLDQVGYVKGQVFSAVERTWLHNGHYGRTYTEITEAAVIVHPEPATARASGRDPSVPLQAEAATAGAGAVDPTVILGPLTLLPSPATVLAAMAEPLVIQGSLLLECDPLSAIAGVQTPLVVRSPAWITGITRDGAGAPVEAATVRAFRTEDNVFVAQADSSLGGAYTVQVANDITDHFLVAYKDGVPDIAGTTLNTLRGN